MPPSTDPPDTVTARPATLDAPGSPGAPGKASGSLARRRPWWPWAAGGAAIVVVALVGSLVVLSGGGGTKPHPSAIGSAGDGGNSTEPAAAAFAFTGAKVTTIRITRRVAAPDVTDAANQIQALLGHLYDQGVVARASAPGQPPASFWDAFAPDIRRQAQADRSGFTLGSTAGSLQALDISSSGLTIRFLVDDKGSVASAVASASIRGTGQVQGSGPVDLVVSGTFLMQRVSGSWLISGYPSASVTVSSPPRASTPPPTTTAPSGSATP